MKTVKIKPTIAYANGKRLEATKIHVKSYEDDLFDNVSFRYTLFDDNNTWAGEAVLAAQYTSADTNELVSVEGHNIVCTWDATADGAYGIVCKSLGLELEVESVDEAGKVVFLEI
jgi:hypothetical protein